VGREAEGERGREGEGRVGDRGRDRVGVWEEGESGREGEGERGRGGARGEGGMHDAQGALARRERKPCVSSKHGLSPCCWTLLGHFDRLKARPGHRAQPLGEAARAATGLHLVYHLGLQQALHCY